MPSPASEGFVQCLEDLHNGRSVFSMGLAANPRHEDFSNGLADFSNELRNFFNGLGDLAMRWEVSQ
jgi:hypothetical protein